MKWTHAQSRSIVLKILRGGGVTLTLLLGGCGTTRWSDTARTATEQLLISDSIDRAVSDIDISVLSGKGVYLETKYIAGVIDEKYITSTLRQHMVASGCILKDKADDASYVVEVRTGGVGTNRSDLLFGVPATNLPTGGMFPLAPTTVPEIPFIKRTQQQGVCKIAVFAYDRTTSTPVWQSGTRQITSKTKDLWVFGAGPFQQGTIHDGVKFAGDRLRVPLAEGAKQAKRQDNVWVRREIVFAETPQRTPVAPPKTATAAASTGKPGAQANYTEPVQPAAPLPIQPTSVPTSAPPAPPVFQPPAILVNHLSKALGARPGGNQPPQAAAQSTSSQPVVTDPQMPQQLAPH